MRTWYFYYPKRLSFYPPDSEIGIGGSEMVLITLSNALAQSGNDVHVFNACYKPGIYDGVSWHMLWEVKKMPAPDIFVAVRFKEAITDQYKALNSVKRYLFWMLDNRIEGALKFSQLCKQRRGKIIVGSAAMIKLLENVGIESSVVQKIEHPIDIGAYTPMPHKERKPICLYCSMPNRGLDALLTIWKDIQIRHPEAQLLITGGYQLWGYTEEEARDKYRPHLKQILALAEKGLNIRYLGNLSKKELKKIQSTSALMLYPCKFPEMFCLSAAECAAAGTPILTSNYCALSERVVDGKNGYLIDGDISTIETQKTFVEKTLQLLSNLQLRESMGEYSRNHSKKLAPGVIARQWEALFEAYG